MTLSEILIDPFTHYAFMRRALAACMILAIGGVPLGLFMTLRRMTLVGDAMSHAILPGVAIAFLVAGLSTLPMAAGGLAAALVVASAAVLLTRTTKIKEDAAFTLLYLMSLAIGVILVSMKGSSVDLMHLLFGNILAISGQSLWLIAGASCLSLFVLAGIYRRLVIDCFDPEFMKAAMAHRRLGPGWTHQIFFTLLMVNLVAAFQALGTLMALGLMILPVTAARFWARSLDGAMALGVLLAIVSSVAGLLISYYGRIPSAPAIVLVAGGLCIVSILVGRCGSVVAYRFVRD